MKDFWDEYVSTHPVPECVCEDEDNYWCPVVSYLEDYQRWIDEQTREDA